MSSSGGMTYASTGVNYEAMDPFKRMAQVAGRETASNLLRFGFSEAEWSRGESCYLIETPDSFLAHVEEGLGTKCLVADAFRELWAVASDMDEGNFRSYYDQIAQCTVAMIVNDMITLGAPPLSVAMHLAVGDSSWFEDKKRCRDLVEGWKKACNLARCAWGGGETPTLRGIVAPEAVVLSGSAIGIVKPKGRVIRCNIQHGDSIILIESSGIHANGLTMAREIADKLPEGYLTKLPDGRTYGEALLDPTRIYVPLVEDCLENGAEIHYAVNVTGHGWRKLMRAKDPFAYVIEHMPRRAPIFDFIQKHGPVEDREAYGNLNMGAGFALYVPETSMKRVWEVLQSYDRPNRFGAVWAGHIERSDTKKVVIKPKGIEFGPEDLVIR